jgi:uncharacterized protein (UPF0216 family)
MENYLKVYQEILDIITEKNSIDGFLNKFSFKDKESTNIVITTNASFELKELEYENKEHKINLLYYYDKGNKYIWSVTFSVNKENIKIIDEICNCYKLKIKILYNWNHYENYYFETSEVSELKNIFMVINIQDKNICEKNVSIECWNKKMQIGIAKRINSKIIEKINGKNEQIVEKRIDNNILHIVKYYSLMVIIKLWNIIIKIFIKKLNSKILIKRNKYLKNN